MQTRWLPVQLTDDEIRHRGAEQAEAIEKLALVAVEKKHASEKFKEEESALQAKMARLARQIISRTEEREVEIEERKLYDSQAVVTVRLDTGEVIHSRPMTPAERQKPLPFSEKGSRKSAEKAAPEAQA